ncbi:MAG TPA: DGQHR domain-containing protein [Sphingomonas sp.]|nr:DGQHR domain-containing protein [Sphingomonas sp.]
MDYHYDAFVFHQRPDAGGPKLAIFLAPAVEVSAWSAVDRLGPDNPMAPQREPAPARIASIARFFQSDPRNTIPTSIVIGLAQYEVEQEGVTAKLTVSTGANGDLKPALVIDGQHRLRGMTAASPEMRVPIVAVLGADDLEMAFQFLVINNKSARVPRDHIRALALNYAENELRERLKSARLTLDPNLASVGVLDEAAESPFAGMISWLNNPAPDRIVVPAAIEGMAAEAKSMGFSEFEDPDTLNTYLMSTWSEVRAQWPELFVAGSKLLNKVGLTCMTHFITSTIKTWARNPHLRDTVNVGDPDKVRSNTRDILATLTPAFFQAEWKSTSYDTRAGRDLVLADLETISFNIANSDPWFEDLNVVDRAAAAAVDAANAEAEAPPANPVSE